MHERLHAVVLLTEPADDALHRAAVVALEAAAERIRQHLLGQRARELRHHPAEHFAHLRRRLERLPRRQRTARVDREAAVHLPPLADRVVVLEPEAERIHAGVTGGANRIRPVLLHLLADRHRLAERFLVERRYVGRRGRQRAAENVLQHVLAADDDRRARRITRHRQHAAVRQHAAALVGGEIDTTELLARHAADAVVPGEQLVEIRVARVEELRNRTVVAENRVEEQLRLGPHGVAQFRSPLRETIGIGTNRIEIADFEPLPREVLRERRGPFVGEHARDLRVEHGRRAELALLGQGDELLVRHGAPQEVAQPRRQLDIRHAVRTFRVVRIQVALDPEEEVGRHQHGLHGQLDALLDAESVGLRHGDEAPQVGDLRRRHGTTVGTPCQIAEDAIDARIAARGLADEHPLPTRFHTVNRERANDGDRTNPLVDLVAIDILGLDRRDVRIVKEPETNRVVAFRHRNPQFGFRVRIEIDEPGRLRFHLRGCHEPAVDPHTKRHRRGVFRPLAGHADAQEVLRVEVRAVRGHHVAGIETAQVAEPQAVLDLDRFRQRLGRDRAGGNPLRCVHVGLHQHRGDREDLADVVEAFAGVVGRERPIGAEVDGQQIANRVGVLGAVEPSRDDTPRVGRHERVCTLELGLEEPDERRDFFVGTRHVSRRHLAGLELVEDEVPEVAIPGERLDRQSRGQVEIGGHLEAVVALAARVVQQRLGGGLELVFGWRHGARRSRGPRRRHVRHLRCTGVLCGRALRLTRLFRRPDPHGQQEHQRRKTNDESIEFHVRLLPDVVTTMAARPGGPAAAGAPAAVVAAAGPAVVVRRDGRAAAPDAPTPAPCSER